MQLVVTVAKCERQQTKAKAIYWDIAFEIEAENYPQQYIPVTVYAYELTSPDDNRAIQLAASRAIPQHVSMCYTQQYNKPKDYFDDLADSLNKETEEEEETSEEETNG